MPAWTLNERATLHRLFGLHGYEKDDEDWYQIYVAVTGDTHRNTTVISDDYKHKWKDGKSKMYKVNIIKKFDQYTPEELAAYHFARDGVNREAKRLGITLRAVSGDNGQSAQTNQELPQQDETNVAVPGRVPGSRDRGRFRRESTGDNITVPQRLVVPSQQVATGAATPLDIPVTKKPIVAVPKAKGDNAQGAQSNDESSRQVATGSATRPHNRLKRKPAATISPVNRLKALVDQTKDRAIQQALGSVTSEHGNLPAVPTKKKPVPKVQPVNGDNVKKIKPKIKDAPKTKSAQTKTSSLQVATDTAAPTQGFMTKRRERTFSISSGTALSSVDSDIEEPKTTTPKNPGSTRPEVRGNVVQGARTNHMTSQRAPAVVADTPCVANPSSKRKNQRAPLIDGSESSDEETHEDNSARRNPKKIDAVATGVSRDPVLKGKKREIIQIESDPEDERTQKQPSVRHNPQQSGRNAAEPASTKLPDSKKRKVSDNKENAGSSQQASVPLNPLGWPVNNQSYRPSTGSVAQRKRRRAIADGIKGQEDRISNAWEGRVQEPQRPTTKNPAERATIGNHSTKNSSTDLESRNDDAYRDRMVERLRNASDFMLSNSRLFRIREQLVRQGLLPPLEPSQLQRLEARKSVGGRSRVASTTGEPQKSAEFAGESILQDFGDDDEDMVDAGKEADPVEEDADQDIGEGGEESDDDIQSSSEEEDDDDQSLSEGEDNDVYESPSEGKQQASIGVQQRNAFSSAESASSSGDEDEIMGDAGEEAAVKAVLKIASNASADAFDSMVNGMKKLKTSKEAQAKRSVFRFAGQGLVIDTLEHGLEYDGSRMLRAPTKTLYRAIPDPIGNVDLLPNIGNENSYRHQCGFLYQEWWRENLDRILLEPFHDPFARETRPPTAEMVRMKVKTVVQPVLQPATSKERLLNFFVDMFDNKISADYVSSVIDDMPPRPEPGGRIRQIYLALVKKGMMTRDHRRYDLAEVFCAPESPFGNFTLASDAFGRGLQMLHTSDVNFLSFSPSTPIACANIGGRHLTAKDLKFIEHDDLVFKRSGRVYKLWIRQEDCTILGADKKTNTAFMSMDVMLCQAFDCPKCSDVDVEDHGDPRISICSLPRMHMRHLGGLDNEFVSPVVKGWRGDEVDEEETFLADLSYGTLIVQFWDGTRQPVAMCDRATCPGCLEAVKLVGKK